MCTLMHQVIVSFVLFLSPPPINPSVYFSLVFCWLLYIKLESLAFILTSQKKIAILTRLCIHLMYFVMFSQGNTYTSAYVNPSLAYALTFNCPGHTFWEYAVVYWLGPLIGKLDTKTPTCSIFVVCLKHL